MTIRDQTYEFENESLRYIKTYKDNGINSDLILPNTLKKKNHKYFRRRLRCWSGFTSFTNIFFCQARNRD